MGLFSISIGTLLLSQFFISDNCPKQLQILPREIADICQDASTQWMVVLGLAGYFLVFLFLEKRANLRLRPTLSPKQAGRMFSAPLAFFRSNIRNPNLWLAALVVLTLLRYALAYDVAVKFMQVPIFLAGIIFGKMISVWIARNLKTLPPNPKLSLVGTQTECVRRIYGIILIMQILLAALALWQPRAKDVFQYHGIPRWHGVLDDPNPYGLLMGTGFVLALGLGVGRWKMEGGGWKWGVKKYRELFLCGFLAFLLSYGLFKSYSRGAWLGTLIGLFYVAIQASKSSRISIWLRRNRLPLTLLVVSLTLLVFWQFRFAEWRPAQRIFSIANFNDFSWRNRVTAWNGARRMMFDRTLNGFGWGNAESAYKNNYSPPRLDGGAAIQINDYLMIGVSAGVPALICFTAYIFCVLKRKQNTSGHTKDSNEFAFTICRAACTVLLIGLWFDGGLFKLSIAPVFWMLMELIRLESLAPMPMASEMAIIPKNNFSTVPKPSFWENRFRRLVLILTAIALIQTIVYLGTPFLQANRRTIAMARKCLIAPGETADFDYLTASSDWRGKRLKTILEHVNLANYNRHLINWQLGDKIYQDYVLSPAITSNSEEKLDWRRSLWEEFYLRIRYESSPEDAAGIVVNHLLERVTIDLKRKWEGEVETIWGRGTTDEQGFEIIYVATLRSVGVGARLGENGKAEFWTGQAWKAAPKPLISSR